MIDLVEQRSHLGPAPDLRRFTLGAADQLPLVSLPLCVPRGSRNPGGFHFQPEEHSPVARDQIGLSHDGRGSDIDHIRSCIQQAASDPRLHSRLGHYSTLPDLNVQRKGCIL